MAGQRRQAVATLCQRFRVSLRRACRILEQPRSTQRYRVKERDGEAALRMKLVRLAKKHPKFGVRRITAVLRRSGQVVNR